MTYNSSQIDESYIPVYDTVPEKWEEARVFLNEKLKAISNALDIREIGWFLDEETLTGQQFIPATTSNQQYQPIFRMVINFGVLPDSSTKSVAHNVEVNELFVLMNLYISATDPSDLIGFSLQYWSVASADIELSYTSTDVVVTTQSDYSNYTTSYVVMEYIQLAQP
jgi:hypothetical protein